MEEIKVLDKGFVRLVDHMGDDSRIVQSARVSYGHGTKTVSEDRGLIRYLMENQHTSPFEQVVFTFHMKLPIFVARQIVRHRTSRLNEVSGRYSVIPDEFYIPEPDRIKEQSKNNKQGSGKTFEKQKALEIQNKIIKQCEENFGLYNDLIDDNLAREEARFILPLNTYTEWYYQMDLRNLFNFLKLRLDKHAQYETRKYAEAIYDLIKPIVPVSCEAFEDFTLNARIFSAQEIKILQSLVKIHNDLNFEELTSRQKKEFMVKLGIASVE